ncbi:hypothetical protein H0H92_014907 [Tricholoma furcatifolium]|nr:hypothetical protein H0H92_014907 [Tricholoma furcatifolium]
MERIHSIHADFEERLREGRWASTGILFFTIGVIESLAYLASFCYAIFTPSQKPTTLFSGAFALTWLYTTLRPIFRPTQTVPYDLFLVYLLLFAGAMVEVGSVLYDKGVYGEGPSMGMLVVVAGNLLATGTALGAVLRMPMALPSQDVKSDDIGVSASPEDYTSLFRWITFSWFYTIVRRGRYATLNEKDVWDLSSTLRSRLLFHKFTSLSPRMSLLRKLWTANSLDLILDFSLTIVTVVFTYGGPFFLKRILDAIDSPSAESRAKAYIYAFLAFLCSLCKSQIEVQHTWFSQRAAARIRSELMASIYDKALKRKDLAEVEMVGDHDKAKDGGKGSDNLKAGASVGKILDLLTSDTNQISITVCTIYFMYRAPFEIILGSISLYKLLGYAPFVGYLVLIIAYQISSYITKLNIRIQKELLAASDKRMAALNELIGALKFIKFFAWEERWISRVMEFRDIEISWLIQARINTVLFSLLWSSTPIAISTLSFFVYVMQGNELTTSKAFTAISLFAILRTPLSMIPTWTLQIIQTGVALNRIAVYLDEDEVDEQVSSLKKDTLDFTGLADAEEAALGAENASFKWNEFRTKVGMQALSGGLGETTDTDTTHGFELRDISVRFPEGELTVITGPAASGKTALLRAILGEMALLPSTPPGRILLSKHLHRTDPSTGLTQSISYAAQTPWLRQQSLRDNILFGAPFDAARYDAVIDACALRVDLEVLEGGDQTEIGTRGISLSGGQRARVALARAVYSRARWVVLDDPLSAMDSGTAQWIVERLLKGELLKGRTVVLVTHHLELVLPAAGYVVRMLDGRIDVQGTVKDLYERGVLEHLGWDEAVTVKEREVKKYDGKEEEDREDRVISKKPRKLVQDERRAVGRVKWAIYTTYLQASSYWIWVFLIFLIVLAQTVGLSEKIWIMIWGEAYKNGEASTKGGLQIQGQPDSFEFSSFNSNFTTTKPGRFGIEWPHAMKHPMFYVGIYACIGLVNMLTSIASMIAQYTGAIRASRSLFRRLLGTVVRATFRFHDTTPQGRILNRFGKDIQTIDSSITSSLQAVNVSLASFFITIISIVAVFPWFIVPACLLGFVYRELGLSYLNTGRDLRRMELTTISPIFSDFGELLEGIATTPNLPVALALELDFNSVERVVEYFDLPQEPPAVIKSNRPPAHWPSSSDNDSFVVVEDLTIKYAPDLPAVLKSVSFSLKAGESVGILGRTGSGKSTLAMSILRFVDPTNGRIVIDGVDISTIGIHDLRSRLTFIPQDVALFSGTLRENVDPFNEHTDAECLDVLQRCHIISMPTSDSTSATATEVSLDTQLSAGGGNFSQGQRQLIAMARALLRRSPIIVLDEATSSIDFAMDAKIQATIREEFASCLLLTVAHRIRTVIDYDRLLVLDRGQIAEFDTPWNLIQKEGGIFRSMCLKSGSFSHLETEAKRKAERDNRY